MPPSKKPKLPAAPRNEPRRPKAMTERRLENIAAFYLQRFSTTAAHLRRVLMRRIDKSMNPARAATGPRRAEMAAWVDRLLARLVRSGAVDDRAFADGLTARLRRLGKGPGIIRARLAGKGVPHEMIRMVLAETAETHDGDDAAFVAALAYARRRGLGPFRDGPDDRDTRRRELGALARAGFSLDVARRVLAHGLDDAHVPPALRSRP
jgi:regulatory protein